MHVSFKIHYRNNLIDKKDSYPISCPPSWDDRNYSYGHQLYPSDIEKLGNSLKIFLQYIRMQINFNLKRHYAMSYLIVDAPIVATKIVIPMIRLLRLS
jgi:hypothetical protein